MDVYIFLLLIFMLIYHYPFKLHIHHPFKLYIHLSKEASYTIFIYTHLLLII